MKKTPEAYIGSFFANRQQQLYANQIATSVDTLTLDANGRMFRQMKTKNYVFKENGGKVVYNINITLVGRYDIKGGKLSFKETLPRLDDNSFDYFPGPEEKDIDEAAIQAVEKAKLESKIAEVLMNFGMQCQQINTGRHPACNAHFDGDTLILKYDKLKGVDKLQRCEEPADLYRLRTPMALEDALKAPETRFVNAVVSGDNDYLINATLYVPCKQEGGEKRQLTFTPLEVGDNKFMLVFSDIHRLKSCSLIDSSSWRTATLPELASFAKVFDGICLNPSRINSVGLINETIDQIINRSWKGYAEQEK